ATVIIAAFDTGRFRWTHDASQTTQIVALAVLILAGGLQVWAMTVNPFFSAAIRMQAERDHELVTSGPYRFVRHPGYLAMTVVMPATALAIGSVAAMIPASGYSALILWRAKREDEFLMERLESYSGYSGRVHYRLVPGIW
ncbi:MAG TPA: isoprenylcysteine carboxylmethyltransferase family protein, partial [Terriglobia bacterium]|nr:isoprenylcysteine carboxylmethyltransferase family protein [Terriglobia bacterium]